MRVTTSRYLKPEWIAGMSHQDKNHLRTPVAELKELLAPLREANRLDMTIVLELYFEF